MTETIYPEELSRYGIRFGIPIDAPDPFADIGVLGIPDTPHVFYAPRVRAERPDGGYTLYQHRVVVMTHGMVMNNEWIVRGTRQTVTGTVNAVNSYANKYRLPPVDTLAVCMDTDNQIKVLELPQDAIQLGMLYSRSPVTLQRGTGIPSGEIDISRHSSEHFSNGTFYPNRVNVIDGTPEINLLALRGRFNEPRATIFQGSSRDIPSMYTSPRFL
jgi:hypothetical protein